MAPGHFVPCHITQPTPSLGGSNYLIIMVRTYRGYSDACIRLENYPCMAPGQSDKVLFTNDVIFFRGPLDQGCLICSVTM